jgi:Flp pilus assembly pilin Flp
MYRLYAQRHIVCFSRKCEGATAVEYALILPILLMFIVGIIEFNVLMYASAVLEGATSVAARSGKTGYTAAGVSQQTYIYNLVKTKVSGILDPTQLQISSKSYANFTAVGKPEPCISPPASPCTGTAGVNFVDVNHNGVWDADQGAAGLGSAGDIVVYTITYPWYLMTPIVSPFFANGKVTLTSSAIVKNEPYNVGVTSR